MSGINHKRYHKDGSVTVTTGAGGWYKTQTFTAEEWTENQKDKGFVGAFVALFFGIPFAYILCYVFGSIVPALFAALLLAYPAHCVYDTLTRVLKKDKGRKEEEQDAVQ